MSVRTWLANSSNLSHLTLPNISACSLSLKTGSPVLNSGDELVLQCSCNVPVVSQSGDTAFFFYKDRVGDMDQDIVERYRETRDDLYRLELSELVS